MLLGMGSCDAGMALLEQKEGRSAPCGPGPGGVWVVSCKFLRYFLVSSIGTSWKDRDNLSSRIW